MPFFKKDASAAERFSEFSSYALVNPECFEKFVICYKEKLSNGNNKYRTVQHNCTLDEEIGLFEIGKIEAMKDAAR